MLYVAIFHTAAFPIHRKMCAVWWSWHWKLLLVVWQCAHPVWRPSGREGCRWPQPGCLCVFLCCSYCGIKQTGDLHYSLGQRGHRERGCHGNGPLHGCQSCLIIHDHHHWASAGSQLEPLNRLNVEIKKSYDVPSWGIQINSPRVD